MRSLIPIFLSILFTSVMFGTTQSIIADGNVDKQLAWIKSILDEESISINSNDYLFYRTGNHGIIWSLITSDTSTYYFYNGTTRKHLKDTCHSPFDTLSFITNNLATIKWGFDSLANTAKYLTPIKNYTYSPFYNELCAIKNNKIVFFYNDAFYYADPDSTEYNLSRLTYLMLWLAAPSLRPCLPTPCDTLLAK